MIRTLVTLFAAAVLAAGCAAPPARSRPALYPSRPPDAPVAVFFDTQEASRCELLDLVETHADGGSLFFQSRFDRALERAKTEARLRGGDCVILVAREFDYAEIDLDLGRRFFVPRLTCRWLVGRVLDEPESPPPGID